LVIARASLGQFYRYNEYFPKEIVNSSDWKYQFSAFANQDANSNTFTNAFFSAINKSGFIPKSLIDQQVESISGKVISGTISEIGLNVFINSKKSMGKRFYSIGFEHHHFLDTWLDGSLVKLLLLGNKPFAGETLQIPHSYYYSNYFNQLKAGMGYRFQKAGTVQKISWSLGFTTGQNYESIEIVNSSIYTHPTGDLIELAIQGNTKNSDTVWADFYQVNGIGLSADLDYTYTRINNFNFVINIQNLGFINWNGNTFSGKTDTAFIFIGLNNDTAISQNELLNDYSYNHLRRKVFKNPESGPFTEILPMSIQLSGGKYIREDRFYIGLKSLLYPTLKANYSVEIFGTWNIKNMLTLTPICNYSSYGKINYGLGIGIRIGDKLFIYAGSAYLNSFFDKNAALGRGGSIRLTFVN
jgi:hypothetical protein